MSTRIPVRGPAPYDVVVGHGVLDQVAALLGEGVERVAVCFPEGLAELAEPVLERLAHLRVLRLPLPDGEAAKTAAMATACWTKLGDAGFTRSDAVVTVGGGATTDVGGFVAATWLRGVAVVHVPTTLLGMVDAAVGGKTGINSPAGKNLVGAFHEPAGVVCDLDLLATLPPAELVAGLGEVVKCGFIADPAILAVVESDADAMRDPASAQLREVIERSVRVKAAVVSADLKEIGLSAGSAAVVGSGAGGGPTAGVDSGAGPGITADGALAGQGVATGRIGREVLNYGHTMAHAVERNTGYSVRHGEAVSLGMVYVAELARRSGRMDDALAARHAEVLSSVGLPTTIGGLDFADLLASMRVDKKARGSHLRFVVLEELARPAILTDPDEADLRAAYDVMAGAR